MSSAIISRVNFTEVATFGATVPVAGDTWEHLPADDVVRPTIDQEVDAGRVGNSRGTMTEDYATVKKSAAAMKVRAHTGTSAFDGAGGDTPPTKCFLQKPTEHYFGAAAVASFAGSTVTGGGNGASGTPVALASVAGLTVGQHIGFGAVGGSQIEFRQVYAISGNDVTLDQGLSVGANFGVGAVVYGGFNFFPTIGEYAKYLYMLHELHGHSWLTGQLRPVSLKLSDFAAMNGARLDWGFEGNSFADGFAPTVFTDNRTTFTGAPVVAKGSPVTINGVDTPVANVTLDFGCKGAWRPETSGQEGRGGYEITALEPTLSLTPFYSSAVWNLDRLRTQFPVRLVAHAGSASTNIEKARGTYVVSLPNCQADATEGEVNSIVAAPLAIKALDPTSAQVALGIVKPVVLTVFGGIP